MNVARPLLLLILTLAPWALQAHEVRPGYLEVKEFNPGQFEVIWKQPVANGRRLSLTPRLPANCGPLGEDLPPLSGYSPREKRLVDCGTEGLMGATIAIDGLPGAMTDVMVRIQFMDGTRINQVLRRGNPELMVSVNGPPPLLAYLLIGIEHLLFGFDHILFVVGLMFAVSNTWTLVKTVTAFTLAHSLTLGLSALDLVRLSQAPVEAVIALSILFLAVELLRRERPRTSLLSSSPWIIALAFGLLHGFGFAGALREIGLPEDAAIWALFLFNLGVEIGQLGIVLAFLLLAAITRHYRLVIPGSIARLPIYGMGTVAAYWVIARVARILI